MKTPIAQLKQRSLEKLEHVTIEKYAEADVAFGMFRDFARSLNKKTGREYIRDHGLHILSLHARNPRTSSVLYAAKDSHGQLCGVLYGEDLGSGDFKGWSLIVDPQHSRTNAARALISEIQKTYYTMHLYAVAQGIDEKKQDPIRAQEILIRFYGSFGFRPDVDDKQYKPARKPGDPLPMIWRK